MRTWSGIGIISTMRSTRLWDCPLGVGWSRVRVSGSSNSASREWGCVGVRPDLTICYISDSPGSTARLRRYFRYSSNYPPTRNYARFDGIGADWQAEVIEPEGLGGPEFEVEIGAKLPTQSGRGHGVNQRFAPGSGVVTEPLG